MNARNPHDLNQIRPNAELDHPSMQRAPTTRPTHGRRRRQKNVRPPRTGWSIWAKIAAGLGVFAGLLVIGLGALLYLVSPTELVRNELIRQVKANTGRDLQIKGSSRLKFYPSIGVSLGKVALSGPPGMTAGPTLTANRIDVSVALMPLLSREVRVEHIGFVRPVIDLHVDKEGRQSWKFAAFQADKGVQVAQLGSGLGSLSDALPSSSSSSIGLQRVAGAGAASGSDMLSKLELRSVNLSKAVIKYRDDRSGARHQIDDLDLQLNGRRISDPLKAVGALVWANEKLTFDARLSTISQILAGRAATTQLTVSGRPISAGFDGTVKLGDKLEITGQTRVSGNSLATTTKWLGMVFPNAGPLGGFRVSGRLVGSPKSIALNGATMNLGDTKANGTILVAMRPGKPYLSADLKMSELDIDRLSAGFAEGRQEMPRRTPVSANPGRQRGKSPDGSKSAPKSIEDLLRRSQAPNDARGVGRFSPQVRGYTGRNEWSSEPIDAAALGLLDAKARLRIDGLKVSGMKIGRTSLRLALENASARIDIDDIQLYGGAGKGVITAKSNGRAIGIGTNLRVDKVAAKALLTDAAGFQRLDGRGDLTVVVSGSGTSQKSIADSLNGTASFVFRDGAIVGWNVAKIIRGLQQGQFSNFDATNSEKTDFSKLSASFKITRGNALTRDLQMTSPLLRLTGAGDIGIGPRNLNLSLRPKLVTSIQGQGARNSGSGLEIPVKLKGPWDAPRIAPDFGGISKDPAQVMEQAKQLGRQFKGGKLKGNNIGDMVRGVLGR